jgi:hypothetical protein
MRRRPWLGGVAVLAVFAFAPTDRAFGQLGGVTSDPFSFYYGYYLPHQQAMATQPRVTDTINQIVARRQYTAQTDRSSLYDPISPYSEEEDQFDTRGAAGGPGRRSARGAGPTQSFSYGGSELASVRGNGPGGYYKRVDRYFPTIREGRGANMNISAMRNPRAGGMGNMGGMGGMPGMPGLPGPR